MPVTKGQVDKKYVSAFTELDAREIDPKVTDVYNEGRFVNTIVRSGRAVPVKAMVFRTFINDALFSQGDTTGATVTGNNSATIGTTLTVATSGFARRQDLVRFITSGKVGVITAISTGGGQDTLTIKSVDGSNITHAAGEKLAFFGVAVGEASQKLDNLRFGVTSYINKIHLHREECLITDIQNAATMEVEYNGQPYYRMKEFMEKKLRFERMIDGAFIQSEMSATSFSDANPSLTDAVGGGAVQTGRGLNKYIESYGITNQVAGLGTYAKADLDAVCDALTAARAQEKQLSLGSDAVLRVVSTYYKALASGGVNSVRLVVSGKELDFTVDQVKYGKFEFHYANLPVLDDPSMFGGTIESKSLFHIPLDKKVKTVDGEMIDAWRTRYVKNQKKYGNDMVGETHYGALNPINPDGGADVWGMSYTSAQSLECVGVQHFLRQRVLS